ncbi:DUF2163 domain-containing protein [Xanthobacter sp. V0B-10]|uniref:DUF2163 domain-containing protein n=1 Tax=Xanthobacter albus TaxID=3119929 RepID=UPI00372823F6
MRSFNSDTLALLDAGRVVIRDMIDFQLGGGTYGFWSGIGSLSYAGLTYVGAGSLIKVGDLDYVSDLSSAAVTFALAGIANSDLTPDTLASIEDEDYHGRPVILRRAYIHPDTRALVSVERIWRGYIDQISHTYTIGGEAVLEVACESRARDNTRRGYRTYADADQRRIDPADGSLRHAATASKATIYWGKLPGQVK